MSDFFDSASIFFEPIGITVLLVYFYGVVSRKYVDPARVDIWMGCIFGVAVIYGMKHPINFSEGVIVDLRNLFVGASAAFFGVRGGTITLLVAISMRITIGGEGAESGVAGVMISAAMGLIWATYIRPRIHNRAVGLLVLGLLISLHLVAAFLISQPIALKILTSLGPTLILLNVTGVAALSMLIERERELVDEAHRLSLEASTDPLTQLLNRRSAIQSYEQSRGTWLNGRGTAMACIDIDNFKQINDTHGHEAGDAVLIAVAERMSDCLRSEDLFCRMSGDEFLIVLPNVTSDEARLITERCRGNVARADITTVSGEVSVSVSIGTVWAKRPEEFGIFRDAADKALYQAKSLGRDCTAFSTKPA